MNVLFIKGSARDDGITAKLCELAASAMPSAKISMMSPHKMDIQHCTGCGSCKRSGKCIIKDDMRKIYKAVEENDVIIISTPVYFSGPSSIIKQVIDRFQCVWVSGKGKPRNKTAALIAAGGDKSPIFSNTISITKAFAMTIGAEWAGELKVSGTDGMAELSDDIVKEACSFGSKIARKHSNA